MQIAIDGPAGAGKSTVARELANRLGFMYLNTGAMYRALAFAAEEMGLSPNDSDAISNALSSISVDVKYEGREQHTYVNGRDVSDMLGSPSIGQAASNIAKNPEVRGLMLDMQRRVAAQHDIVMDGRDIASCVLPDADYKFFLTASVRTRAERRLRELEEAGNAGLSLEEIENQIRDRDEQDTKRSIAPLRHTPGEILVDTSAMNQMEVVRHLADIVNRPQ